MLVFLWALCCLWLPEWHLPTAWLRSAFWYKGGKSVCARARLCSSNLGQTGRENSITVPNILRGVGFLLWGFYTEDL